MSTGIEWCEETWNPIVGCTPVSAGCAHCYAATMARRLRAMGRPEYQDVVDDYARWTGVLRFCTDRLKKPLHWRKPRRIFVNSMSDLFHDETRLDWIDAIYDVMRRCPRHTFMVLTKRPLAMYRYWLKPPFEPLPNVWIGTSVENQAQADLRIPHLLRCPAAVRFVSCEPLLGSVNFTIRTKITGPGSLQPCAPPTWGVQDLLSGYRGSIDHHSRGAGYRTHGLDWVIVGGESGPGARPCHVAWIRSIVEQCRAARVPVFVKQLGRTYWEAGGVRCWPKDQRGADMETWLADLRVREWPKGASV